MTRMGPQEAHMVLPDYDIEKNNCSDDTAFDIVTDGKGQDHGNDEDESQAVGDLSHENRPKG